MAKSEAVQSWKLEILDSGGGDRGESVHGGRMNMPEDCELGRQDRLRRELPPRASYTARLSVDYGSAFCPGSTTSSAFVLDITPPTGTHRAVGPVVLSYRRLADDHVDGQRHIEVAKIESWTHGYQRSRRPSFMSSSAKWPDNQVVWNGKGINGDMVQSAENYPVVAKVLDEFGNTGS